MSSFSQWLPSTASAAPNSDGFIQVQVDPMPRTTSVASPALLTLAVNARHSSVPSAGATDAAVNQFSATVTAAAASESEDDRAGLGKSFRWNDQSYGHKVVNFISCGTDSETSSTARCLALAFFQ